MGLPILALSKLALAAAATSHGLTPMVAVLLWPFILKISFNFPPLQQACTDMLISVRLFFFQMGRITFDRGSSGGGERWQRALRLVVERVVHTRHAHAQSRDDTMLHLSMLAL